jgi:hypothetical protein
MDGSIIAIIITTHIPTNDPATPSQVCPGIRIQAIDIVQPPGIIMPPVADIEVQQTTVTAALTPNRRPQTARKAGCEMRSEGMREIYCEAMSLRLMQTPFQQRRSVGQYQWQPFSFGCFESWRCCTPVPRSSE